MTSAKTKSGYLILVVDDLPEMREMRKYILEREGFRVIEAEDGQKGVAAAIRERPRLILMNYMMPVMNGLEAAAIIRRQPGLERVPILMNSGCEKERMLDKALQAGCNDYLEEPCFEELFEKVMAYVLVG